MAMPLQAHALGDVLDWWEEVNNSTLWQDRIFHALAALFGLVSAVALVMFLPTACKNLCTLVALTVEAHPNDRYPIQDLLCRLLFMLKCFPVESKVVRDILVY
ncbi:hypothetical protein BHM03_00039106 [Ensete ventricosum]|nr:hypothetical protein BHM03_00039106 [Ensete ventricosum]